MFKKIMVPVDLAHTDALDKALTVAADLSRHYNAPIAYVGVTGTAPSEAAGSDVEYKVKLAAFAADQASKRGIQASADTVVSHDPAAELHSILLKEYNNIGADLVVMASHMPGVLDHIFSSNAGHLASHADVSVVVVR